jgi:hypothetical protein
MKTIRFKRFETDWSSSSVFLWKVLWQMTSVIWCVLLRFLQIELIVNSRNTKMFYGINRWIPIDLIRWAWNFVLIWTCHNPTLCFWISDDKSIVYFVLFDILNVVFNVCRVLFSQCVFVIRVNNINEFI